MGSDVELDVWHRSSEKEKMLHVLLNKKINCALSKNQEVFRKNLIQSNHGYFISVTQAGNICQMKLIFVFLNFNSVKFLLNSTWSYII